MFGLLTVGLLLSVLQPVLGINVYLNPPRHAKRSLLSPAEASAVLSRHLGLESFEPFRQESVVDFQEENFVGQGVITSYLLTLEESDVEAVLSPSQKPSFTLSSPPVSSLYTVISTYLGRARHAYMSIFEASPSFAHYKDSEHLTTFLNEAEESEFSAIDLSGLADVRKTYGSSSDEFVRAASAIRDFIQRLTDKGCTFAILTYTPPATVHYSKRQSADSLQSQVPLPSPPPQQPIGSVSTCFESEDVCQDSTESCSGRGQCVQAAKAGRTCYVCTCGATTTGTGTKTKTDYWVGESCERKDVSGPFVLFVGTGLVLLFVVVGSISLLTAAGAQELPSTLLGGAVNAKKD